MKTIKIPRIDVSSKSFKLKRNKMERDLKLKMSILNQKLSSVLIRKYNNVFSEKHYTQDHLLKDIKNLTNNIELDNFLFDRLVLEIERVILNKVIKGRVIDNDDCSIVIKKSRPFDGSVRKSVDLIKPTTKPFESSNNEETVNTKNSKITMTTPNQYSPETVNSKFNFNLVNKDFNYSFSPLIRTDRLNRLKLNQHDDWALIAKYNYLMEQEDKKKKHEKQMNQHKFIRNELDQQLIEKNIKQKETVENEFKYYIHHTETLNELDKNESKKQKLKKEEYMKEKSTRDNLLRFSVEKKKKEREIEMIKEMDYIETVKNALIMDENLKKSSKEKNKIFVKEIKDDLEKKSLENSSKKERERLQNKMQYEQYFKNLEQLEIEREEKIKKNREKVKEEVNKYDNYPNFKEIEKKIHLTEMDKIENEKKKIEKAYLKRIENEKKMKELLTKEMTITLHKQMEQKKLIESNKKEHTAILGKQILKDVDEFHRNNSEKSKNLKTTYLNYQNDLKRQLEEVNMLKVNCKDERQTLLSKELIYKIKSSPLMKKIEQEKF